MIKKKLRLPGSEFRAGAYRTARTPYFLLKVKENALGKNRVGIVVGKSVHATAVKRNLWKRQAKAGLLKAKSMGKDFLVVFSPRANELTKKQFQETLKKSVALLD